ncbi:MAG: aspartate aminotransferase family protein [Bacteroidales bacterium]|nr:aspartate aminotransferase family protein [Bacteroidales bacterium]
MGSSYQNSKKDLLNQNELYHQACEVIPGGISRNTVYREPHPSYADYAEGCYITDIEGARRIDFANNMASLIHGHAHPAVVDAVMEQVKKGTAYMMATEAEVRFAQLLCDRVPGFEKIRFVNSGTEAVMAMIKASRAFTGRTKIAKAEGAYHGTYDFAEVSQTSNPANWGDISKPNSVPLVKGTPQGVLNDVIIFPFNDVGRTLAILDQFADQIACVMIDPVPHRVGLFPGDPEFLDALYKWTRKNDALLVFDEVVTFRVNYGGAQENCHVRPDLTALGKIIGGGFPVGALAGRSDVMKVMDQRESPLLYSLSGTFSANPISLTAGRVTMELFNREAVNQLNELTRTSIDQLREAIKIADVPVSITGAGSMFRFHLKASPPKSYRETYQNKKELEIINSFIDHLFLKENILVINTGSCMFSTALTRHEIDRLTEGVLNGLRKIKPELEKLS